MRLVCPRCGAQYEVDANLIPPAGRDVQCSACGHAWFQGPSTEDAAAQADEPSVEAPGPVPEARAAAAPDARLPARELDPGVLDVLREEAEREARARRAETPATGSAPEREPASALGADRPQAPSQRSRRIPRPAPEDAAPPPQRPESAAPRNSAASNTPTDRSMLLPDIDSISSTLSPDRAATSRSANEDEPEEPQQHGGFLRGFLLMLGVMILALALYIGADALAEAAPGLAPVLDAYVAAIDRAHLWVVQQVDAALAWVQARSG